MKKKKAPPPVSDINVTPMVDVMLVLLIIFMVITPMLSKTLDIDLYKGKNPKEMEKADAEDAVIVWVTRNGKFYLSPGHPPVPTTPDKLPQQVQDFLKNTTTENKNIVYVKADSRAQYKNVEDVVDNLRAAGIENIGLLTDLMPAGDRQQPGQQKKAPAAPSGPGG
jgi:biopolymer transport protein ExbD/biopolymer transport protein TolR